MDNLKSLLDVISVRMPAIRAYSGIHFLIVAAIIFWAAITVYFCIKTCLSTQKLMLGIGIFLGVTEILKQLFLLYHRNWDYSFLDFPFQLCSIPMYLCLLYPLMPKAKQTIIDYFCMTFGLMGGIAALAEPTSCFTEFCFLTIHSLLWHAVLVFLGIYFIRTYQMKWESEEKHFDKHIVYEFVPVIRLYVILSAIALLLNIYFDMISEDGPNLFFIGPCYPGIVILDDIYLKFGWFVETCSMMGACSLGALLLFMAVKKRAISIKTRR